MHLLFFFGLVKWTTVSMKKSSKQKEEALGQKLKKDKLFSSDDSKISDDPLV